MSVNRTTSSPPAATAAAEFPPAEVHQKPPTPPPPTDDAQAIPHTSFFHRQSSSRSSSGGGRSSSAVVPADDYGIVAYELDPWDRGDGDDGEGGEEEKEEAMLHAGWIRKAEEEVCEKRQWRQRDIQALREMVQEAAPSLTSPLDDGFLLRFLRAQKFDYERAFAMLKRYFLMRKSHPENFARALPSAAREIFSHGQQTVLEHRDAVGRRIFLFRTGVWDPYAVTPADIFAANYLCLEMVAREAKSQVAGLVMVVDMAGLSFSHIMHITTEYVRSVANIIQSTFPLRFREIHIINESYLFDFLFTLIKPFLSEIIRNRIQFHGSNLKTLHDKISPRILPEEFGGEAGPMDNVSLVAAMLKKEHDFRELSRYGFTGQNRAGATAMAEGEGHSIPAPFQTYCMVTESEVD